MGAKFAKPIFSNFHYGENKRIIQSRDGCKQFIIFYFDCVKNLVFEYIVIYEHLYVWNRQLP